MSKFRRLIDRFDGWKVLDGRLLKRLRSPSPQKKIPLKKVARDLGKSLCQLSAYENEKSIPTLKTLKEICLYYQVSADLLLGLRWIDEED